MALAHFKGMAKFSLVLRGPKRTAVIAAPFLPFLRCCCHPPPPVTATVHATSAAAHAVTVAAYTVTVAGSVLCRRFAALNIIPCHCYHPLHPAVQEMKLLLRTTAVIDLNLMQIATVHSKCTYGKAVFL